MFNIIFLVRHSLRDSIQAIHSPNLSCYLVLQCLLLNVDAHTLFVVFFWHFVCYFVFFSVNILNIVPRPLFCSVASLTDGSQIIVARSTFLPQFVRSSVGQTALCTDHHGKVSNTVQPSIEVPDYQSIVSKHFKQCKYQEQYQVMTMLNIAPD